MSVFSKKTDDEDQEEEDERLRDLLLGAAEEIHCRAAGPTVLRYQVDSSTDQISL